MSLEKFILGDANTYQLREVISKTQSSVYSAIDQVTGQLVCVKIIELDEQELQKVYDYIEIWRKISQFDGILSLEAFYVLQKNDIYQAHMVTKLAITSLDKYLSKCFEEHKYLKSDELVSFIKQTLNALVLLQKHNTAHRNLKPENILLVDEEKLEWVICDLSCSIQMKQEDQTTTSQQVSDVYTYTSPESYENFRKQNFAPNYNPFKSDLFSLGLIWIQAASFYKFSLQSRTSLKGPKYQQALRNLILSVVHRYPEICGLQEVFEMALHVQPSQRLEPTELFNLIVEHQYLEHDELQNSINSIQLTNNHSKTTDQQGFLLFHVPKDFNHIEFYNSTPNLIEKAHFDFNDLCVMPEDFQMLSQRLLTITNQLKLSGLKLSFELNGIDERHIQPISDLIQRFQLKELYIQGWNNQLRDPGLHKLLLNIQYTGIQKFFLSVSLNKLTNKSLTLTIDLILKMKALLSLSLDFSMNQLTPDASLLITQLKEHKFESLQLNFENNLINDRLCEEILSLKKTLRKFKLNVSSTAVSDNGLIQIGTFVEQLPNLQSLSLTAWNTSIKDKGLNEFMRSLQKAPQLKKLVLVLRSNKITSEQKILGESLVILLNLQYLEINLSSTMFGDIGTTTLSKALVKLTQLHTVIIKLENTQLSKVACRYIGRLPANLKSLQKLSLNLSSNKLEAEGVELLSAGLRLSQNLQYLELILDSIQCGDEGCHFLSEGLKKFHYCKEIILQMCKNQISNIGLTSLMDQIVHFSPQVLENLVLDLSLNDITVETEDAVLLSLKKFKNIDIKLCSY